MSTRPIDGSELFAHLARDLASQADVEHTMQRIAESARELTGSDLVVLWSLTGTGPAAVRAATDHEMAEVISRVVNTVSESPGRQALAEHRTVLLRDVAAEDRWPAYRAAIMATGLPIRCALAFVLDINGHNLGALGLYASTPDFFTDELIRTASVLADHATIALETATAADKAEHLTRALESNRRIGMAIGVLMSTHQLTDKQGFDMLRVASQNNHQKLREVAEQVILTGALPEWPTRHPAA